MAHKNLKKAFEAMFDEIYNGSEKFPIYSISGWSWSGRSEHSCGTAIDINPKENYYCDPMGNPPVRRILEARRGSVLDSARRRGRDHHGEIRLHAGRQLEQRLQGLHAFQLLRHIRNL